MSNPRDENRGTGGALGLSGCEPRSRFSERPCLKRIMWEVIEQDTQCPLHKCTHMHIHAHANMHTHMHIHTYVQHTHTLKAVNHGIPHQPLISKCTYTKRKEKRARVPTGPGHYILHTSLGSQRPRPGRLKAGPGTHAFETEK